jgi:FMN-dependent NADH-azoreductase
MKSHTPKGTKERMTQLLYIEASPLKEASTSTAVAKAWLEAWRNAHPDSSVDIVNVWDLALPSFDADMIAAKFAVMRKQDATAEQQRLWAQAVAMAQRFNAADEYLISTPMWNFGVPYRLKHFIDIVTLPGQNWRWSKEEGYVSLLPGKRATLVYSSAGDYPVHPREDASDFVKPFLRRWLQFLGIDVVAQLNAAPTLAAQADVHAMKQALAAQAAIAAVDGLRNKTPLVAQ